MAIDPKELRIGCHINSDFGMVKVYSLPLKKYDHMPASEIQVRTVNDDSAVLGFDTDFDPIPITPELLTEIGFEKHEAHGRDVFRRLYKDTPLGKMYYVVNYNPNAEAWNFCVHPTATEVKYLHELESIAYFATKQELIND